MKTVQAYAIVSGRCRPTLVHRVPEEVDVSRKEPLSGEVLVDVRPDWAAAGGVAATHIYRFGKDSVEGVAFGRVVKHGVQNLRIERSFPQDIPMPCEPRHVHPRMGKENGHTADALHVGYLEEIQVVLQDAPVLQRTEMVPAAGVDVRLEVSHIVVAQQEHHLVRVFLLKVDDFL